MTASAGRMPRQMMDQSGLRHTVASPRTKASIPSDQRKPSTQSWVSFRSKRSRLSAGASRKTAKTMSYPTGGGRCSTWVRQRLRRCLTGRRRPRWRSWSNRQSPSPATARTTSSSAQGVVVVAQRIDHGGAAGDPAGQA